MRDDERFVPADQLPPGLYEQVRALVNAAEVREGYTVPWLAGRSIDGARFYPDVALPFEVAGVKTRRTTGFHELAEWLMMNEGHTYDGDSDPPGDAHYIANGVEKLEVEAQGGAWEPYCLGLRPLIKATDDPALTNLPPKADWDRRPYEDDDPTLAAEIDAADKSTFAAPVSPTGGLQNYDLEGARARRRKRRKATMAGDPATKESTMDQLKLFVPIAKVDAAQRIVYGTAVDETPDRTKEVFDYETSKPLFQAWSSEFEKLTDGKSLGNVRSMHGAVAAGKLNQIGFDDARKAIDVAAKIVDDAEWQKVQEGVYTGFSIGGKYAKKWRDGELTRYTAQPSEVSIVDYPCVPSATFSMIKADGTTELRKFKTVEVPVSSAEAATQVAAKAVALAKAAGDDSKWRDHIDAAAAELAKANDATWSSDQIMTFAAEWKDGVAVPPAFVLGLFNLQKILKAGDPLYAILKDVKESDKVEPLIGKIAALAGDDDIQRGYFHKRLPGKVFRRKAELEQALIDLDATETAKKTAAPVLDALGIKNTLAKAEGGDAAADVGNAPAAIHTGETIIAVAPAGNGMAKKDYSDEERKQGAKEGWAKKDGSYPIKTATDVANAVKDWFRSKGSASDKRHIIKRAKAVEGGTDQLPTDWSGSTKKDDSTKVAGDGDLAKGVWLYDLSSMLSLFAQVEQFQEVVDRKEWGPFVSLPPELQARLTAMTGEFGDIIAEMLDLVLAEIKPEQTSEAVANAALAADLQKLVSLRALAKAGAKHARADKERIKKAHDLLTELDPDCCPAGDGAADDAEKLAKQLAAERGAHEKLLNDTILPAIKELVGRLDKIGTDVKTIAAQPLPMGTSSVTTLHVAEKRTDFDAMADQLTGPKSGDGLHRFADALQLQVQTRGVPRN